LQRLVLALKSTLSGRDFEIIIINDKNPDGSVEVIKKLTTEHKEVRGLFSETRRGKTKAIRDGFKDAKGDVIVVLDADLQYSPTDVPKLVQALRNADVANGSRVHRKDNLTRKMESRIYNSLIALFLNVTFQDCNSGLKVFKRKVLEDVLDNLRDGWHRYLLVLAVKKGYQIVEVPIAHNSRKVGLSKYPSSPLKLFNGFCDLLFVKAFVLKNQLNWRSAIENTDTSQKGHQ
jgi:dolichol-phosphate mannosyltransferase